MKKIIIFTLFIATSQSVLAQLPTPVACYPFSGNANDMSGNNLHGVVNGATLTADRFGNLSSAYSFNGSNNFIYLPAINNFISADDFSLSFWAKSNLSSSQSAFIATPDIFSDRFNIHIQYNHNGVTTNMLDYGNCYLDGRLFMNAVTSTSWIHYVCVVSVSQDFMAFYTNGVLSLIEYHSSSLSNKSRSIYIGGGSSYFFNGQIDDVVFYDEAISASDVVQLYNNGTACLTSNIDDSSPEIGIHIYPNPSTLSFVNITSAQPVNSIVVYNAIGAKLIHEDHFTGTACLLDLSAFDAGVFFVDIEVDGVTYRRKVVRL